LEQRFETSICFPALFEDLACVNQGLAKSLLIIRFQEIVNSVHFECTNGVRIVSRDKDIYGSRASRWRGSGACPRYAALYLLKAFLTNKIVEATVTSVCLKV